MKRVIEERINIRIAEYQDLIAVLEILDNAGIWMYEIGVTNQWVPARVFLDRENFISSIEQKQIYIASIENVVLGRLG
jgi:hypothetical protein